MAISLQVLIIVVLAMPPGVAITDDAGGVHRGLLYTVREAYSLSPVWSILMPIFTAIMLWLLNKAYDYVRDVPIMAVTIFIAQLPAWRDAIVLGAGTVMPLAVALLAVVVFESFDDKNSQRRAVSAAGIVGLGALFDYAYLLVGIPVVLGLINAKAFSWRVAVATVLGLIAPAWVVLATGLAHLSDLNALYIHPIWLYQPESTVEVVEAAVVGVMCLTAFVIMLLNLVATFSLRLVLRVYNSYFHFATVAVIVAIVIDYGCVATYLPLLAMCIAHQVALHFSMSRSLRSLPAVIVLVLSVLLLGFRCYPMIIK